MSYTADQIEEIVKNILTDMLENVLTKEKLDEKYLEFRTKNRMFYETILTGGFDPVIFNEMMKSKRKLESGVDQYCVPSLHPWRSCRVNPEMTQTKPLAG